MGVGTMSSGLAAVIILLLAANLGVIIYLAYKLLKYGVFGDVLKQVEKNESRQKEIYKRLSNQQTQLRVELANQDRDQRKELNEAMQSSFSSLSRIISENVASTGKNQNDRLLSMEERLKTFSLENEQKLSDIRQTIEKRLDTIQNENNQKLDEMRNIVTEKLNKTIDERMTQSFKLVSDRLEQVYKGLGEMQSLAVGVGDLKKVLSNVKTRGILGEIQLGAILRDILGNDQYCENAAVKPGSRNVVEFAIKLPSQNNGFVYLPIDSKFPGDTYTALREAVQNADAGALDIASKNLVKTLKAEAKDIHDKYICPPYTTDFAVMFLPFEGLYAEAVNLGLMETLQREYKVCIAGPGTMGAFLNSLQMGFKTLAVQKRTSEVWGLLGEVSQEFDTFAKALAQTQERLRSADSELEKLVGIRTRQMQKKLDKIAQYDNSIRNS